MTPRRIQAAGMHDRAVTGSDDNDTRYRLFCSAVGVDPDFAQGWMTLGNRLGDLGLLEASAACYQRVLCCPIDKQPGSLTEVMLAQAYCNLAMRLHHLGDNGAEDAALVCVDLDPNMAFGWTNLAMIRSRRGDHAGAIEAGRRAFALDPAKPENELGLGFALLFAGQFGQGLKHFEARFAYKLQAYQDFPYQKWQGERLIDGGTLFIVAEQGLGDSISYARFVPAAAARAKRTIFAVQPELVRLLSAVLPGVEVIPYPKTFPQADAWVAVCSLPTVLGLSDAAFANAAALPVPGFPSPAGWRLPGDTFRIGICWGGSKANDIDKWRSLAGPFPFLALYEIPGVELYSFQIGDRAVELHTAGAVALIRDLSPWIRDAADAAAILKQMDLAITVETFLGHLAGFMDVPCWVLDSYNGGDYRLGRASVEPIWYGKHRVFRQGPDADWGPVWAAVVAALTDLMKEWNDERDRRHAG